MKMNLIKEKTYVIYLSNGLRIIGNVDNLNLNNDEVTMNYAYEIYQNEQGVSFLPHNLMGEDFANSVFMLSHIVSYNEASDDVIDAWKKATDQSRIITQANDIKLN
jgi:hypothetical protein